MKPLIPSLIHDDTYKLTMGQAVFNQFPRARARYVLQDREPGRGYPINMDAKVRDQLQALADLRLTRQEHSFLRSLRYIKPTYADYLLGYRYDADEVTTFFDRPADRGHYVELATIEGPWYRTIWWEVKLLLLTSALSFEGMPKLTDWKDRIKDKARRLSSAGMKWIDFGTRRAFDLETQDEVVRQHKDYSAVMYGTGFRGTSNLYLAMVHGVTPQGTIAHEFFQAMQAVYGPQQADRMAMDHWVREYEGDLGIVLPDTLTTDVFLRSFDRKQAKLWDGVRLDSGDLLAAAGKFVRRYEAFGIDPCDKVFVPSDGLTVDSAIAFRDGLRAMIGDRAKVTAGIGTHLVNDCGYEPRKIVCKLDALDPFGTGDWVPVVKLSDVAGKESGLPHAVRRVREAVGVTA